MQPTEIGAGPSGIPVRWRLLIDGAADGATNMAIDETILQAAIGGQGQPTLRFYTWHPATLSIGAFQAIGGQIDVAACQAAGIALVRRPTGGRAVLHDREVTYSLVVPVADPGVSGSIQESYRKISAALLLGLQHLGVPAEAVPHGERISPSEGQRGAACFTVASSFEITVGGRKVIGSAQMRQGGYLLQHGSVLLEAEPCRLARLLAPSAAGPAEGPRSESPAQACRAHLWTLPNYSGTSSPGRRPEGRASDQGTQARPEGRRDGLQYPIILARFISAPVQRTEVRTTSLGAMPRRSTAVAEREAHLRSRMVGLCEALGRPVDVAQVVEALAEGFRQALGVTLDIGTLSSTERALAARLRVEKYGSAAWSLRR